MLPDQQTGLDPGKLDWKMKRNFLFLALIWGCTTESEGVSQKEPPSRSRPTSQMSLSERESSPLSKQWLIGYWAYEGACSSDLETAIWPDGTYTMGDGRGRWSLSGDS